MQKIIKNLVASLLVLLVAGLLVACNDSPPPSGEGVVYGVSFNTGIEGVEIETQAIEKGGKVVKPADILREGYKFVAWKKGEQVWYFDTDTVNESFELVAEWEEDPESWEYTHGLSFIQTADEAGYIVSGYTGTSAEVKLPLLLNGGSGIKKVVGIDANAFKNNKTITKITLGNNIEAIGESAFEGTTKLKLVEQISGVKSIGKSAFLGSGVVSVALPATLTTLGESAFKNCSSLVSVRFETGALPLIIPASAFLESSVKTAVISDNILKINESAFQSTPLESLVFGSASRLESIGDYAFNGTKLKHVRLPNSLKTIGNEAFSEITSIKSVVLPSSIQAVGKNLISYNDDFFGVCFSGAVPIMSGFDREWRDWRVLTYAYSASDPGAFGYWKLSNLGTPELWHKNKVISLDFSGLDYENPRSLVVIIECYYPAGVDAIDYDHLELVLDQNAQTEFFVDEYAYIGYNIFVYEAGSDTSDYDATYKKLLEVDIKQDSVAIF